MAFILARNGMAQDNIQKKKIADWTAANQLLYSHTELIKTEIGFSPLFHGPADDYSTLAKHHVQKRIIYCRQSRN